VNTQTRLKLTLGTAAFLALVILIALFGKMETVATAGIAAIMTILSAYIWSQTQRPSIHETKDPETKNKRSKPNAGSGSGDHTFDHPEPQ